MWLLNEVKNGHEAGQQRLLCPGRTYTVGRRDSTITIEDDKSVSRKHATIIVEETDSETGLQNVLNPSKRSSVTIRDEGAKYGTFVNTAKVSPNRPHELRDNDLIKFGTLTSLWRLTWFPVVICCSGLRSLEKERIYRAALELDIKISKAWVSDICTHLYMKDIRPTEKALLAIADLCPIISATWIDRIGENKDSTNFHFPPVEEHQPPLNAVCESVAEKPNFLPMPRRKNIFRDTTIYVFSEDQHYRILPLISKCGGDVVKCNFGVSPWDSQESIQQLIAKDVSSIILYPPSNPGDSYDAYHTRWKILCAACHRLGERLIAEVEIGWAIVFGTTEAYCNKYAQDPIEATSQTKEVNRPREIPNSSHQDIPISTTSKLQSSLASDISTPVVKSRPPAPPSWVLGDIDDDIGPVIKDGHSTPSRRRYTDVAEGSGSGSRSTEIANVAENIRAPKRNLNAFLDAMFDDLDEVDEGPPVTVPMESEPKSIIDEPPMQADTSESSKSHNTHVDGQRQGKIGEVTHSRQKIASIAEVNSRTWEASSDEGERDTEAQVAPEIIHDGAGEEAAIEDENMERSEDEATMVALIKEKQQSFKAAARRSREAAAEADEAFVPDSTERYSTVVVQTLVKTPPTTPPSRTSQASDGVVNFKRFRKTLRPQHHNEMSYIRMLPHDEIQSAMQEVYWLQRDQPQSNQITRPGSQGGEKLTFD